MRRALGYLVLMLASLFAVSVARAGELQVPKTVTAGAGLSVPTTGSGSETLYLFGPNTAVKRKVDVGGNVQITGDEVQSAGRYTVVIGDNAGTFYVVAGKPSNINFLARPSRV